MLRRGKASPPPELIMLPEIGSRGLPVERSDLPDEFARCSRTNDVPSTLRITSHRPFPTVLEVLGERVFESLKIFSGLSLIGGIGSRLTLPPVDNLAGAAHIGACLVESSILKRAVDQIEHDVQALAFPAQAFQRQLPILIVGL